MTARQGVTQKAHRRPCVLAHRPHPVSRGLSRNFCGIRPVPLCVAWWLAICPATPSNGKDETPVRRPPMGNFLQDLRFAVRQFRTSPGFAITAVLSLMLGIGATTAIFSVVYAILVDPY